MTDDESLMIDALREVGYPASSASGLVRQAAGLGSNGASIAGWINEIGALTARVQELEASVAAVAAPDDPAQRGDSSAPAA